MSVRDFERWHIARKALITLLINAHRDGLSLEKFADALAIETTQLEILLRNVLSRVLKNEMAVESSADNNWKVMDAENELIWEKLGEHAELIRKHAEAISDMDELGFEAPGD